MIRLLLLVSLALGQQSCIEADCWSNWSPCTVACKNIDWTTNFALRWRRWECAECLNITQPDQLAQFDDCEYRVPFCLWHENLEHFSTRTVTRIVALSIAIFLIAVPSVAICCRYTSGHPLVCFCCRKKKQEGE